MDQRSQPSIGWIGIGSMGLNMAKNIQKHLATAGALSLCFTNRTLSRGAPLEELGAISRNSIADAVKQSDIVFSSISDDSVLDSIVTKAISTGNLGDRIVVDTSTVNPDSSVAASEKLFKAGSLGVAAPIFSASPVAEAGQLLFIVAGPTMAPEAISAYLKEVMGRGVIHLGEDVSKSSLMKTSGNFITAAMIEIISEARVFTEKTGLGSDVMETLIQENYGPLAYTCPGG